MSDTILEAGLPVTARAPTSIVAWHEGRGITVAELLGDAQLLSRRLPDRGVLINLCANRYAFLVGYVACVLRGRPCLLSGDRTWQRSASLLGAYPDSQFLIDEGTRAPHGPSIDVPVLSGTLADAPASVPAPDQVTTIAFTSGSTGEPVPHSRSWGSQARQIDAVSRRFGVTGPTTASIVATVPHGHMFGFETTILLPLRANVAVHTGTPLYPDDIRRQLEAVPSPRILVTSPVHLRALANSSAALPPIQKVISATAPLPVELASRIELAASTQLHEIYGCTEAGSVAGRRTVEGTLWKPFEGLVVEASDRSESGTFQVRLPEMRDAVPLHDLLALEPNGAFQLLGRLDDMIKVGGKRASLAALTSALLAIDGVEDGAFVMPEHADGGSAIRPVALVVAPKLTPKLVLDGLRRRIDPAFVPRRVVMADALPRDPLGKLPKARVAVLLDAASADERSVTIDFPADHPALPGHFPERPLIPGVVLLDAIVRNARAAFELGPLDGVTQAKFMGPVPPGAVTTVGLRRLQPNRVAFEVRLHGEIISTGELRFRGSST
jgi:3-hydroxymyristoyl/3-hydroxydecanoyl-(acyl carrier protein) dehydratase